MPGNFELVALVCHVRAPRLFFSYLLFSAACESWRTTAPQIEPSLVCLCRSVFLDTRRGGASCICSATPGRAWCGLNQGSDRARTHAALTSMCLTLSCASLVFGRLIVRTPFLNDASILAASTAAGLSMLRRKAP